VSDGRLTLSFDAFHDADAGLWVATSAEGRITTEAPSRDNLIERLTLYRMFSNRGSAMLRATFRSSSIGKNYAPLSRPS
jgi:hypothetical protein